MPGRRHSYRPRFFEGRIMTPDEQERLYKRLCQLETIGPVSDSMRRLIQDVWPELVSKLLPKHP
jgi:hypothetical protein